MNDDDDDDEDDNEVDDEADDDGSMKIMDSDRRFKTTDGAADRSRAKKNTF